MADFADEGRYKIVILESAGFFCCSKLQRRKIRKEDTGQKELFYTRTKHQR